MQDYSEYFKSASQKSGIPEDYLRSIANIESSGNHFDESGDVIRPRDNEGNLASSAIGIMQIIPRYHKRFDPELLKDPDYNIHASARIIKDLYDETDPSLSQAERLHEVSKRYYGSEEPEENTKYADKVYKDLTGEKSDESLNAGIQAFKTEEKQTKLDALRKINPAFKRMDDDSLFEHIKEKYYPDVDPYVLAEKIGYQLPDKPISSDIAETGRAFKRGLFGGVNRTFGQAIKSLSTPLTEEQKLGLEPTSFTQGMSGAAYEYGQKAVDIGEQYEKEHPADMVGRGPVAESFIKGMEAIPPSLSTLAAYAIPGLGKVAGPALTMAVFGGSGYQDTYEKIKSFGGNDEDAKNGAAISGWFQGGLEIADSALTLATAGLFKSFTASTIPLAIKKITETSVVKPFVKANVASMAGQTASELVQDFATKAAEEQYGVPSEQSYMDVGKDIVKTMVGMTGILSIFGAPVHIVNSNRAKVISSVMNDGTIDPDKRTAVVSSLYEQMKDVPGADHWVIGAKNDIKNGVPIRKDTDLTSQDILDSDTLSESIAVSAATVAKPVKTEPVIAQEPVVKQAVEPTIAPKVEPLVEPLVEPVTRVISPEEQAFIDITSPTKQVQNEIPTTEERPVSVPQATTQAVVDEQANIEPEEAQANEAVAEEIGRKQISVKAPLEETTQSLFKGLPIVEAPLADIKLSRDVPQFKEGANKKGVVEPLEGTFDRTGVAPVQLWERTNGDLELISGRHRADLANRSGETTIPAQVHKESEGFTVQHAAMLDAELNIRDGQGTIKDYVNYFKNSGISKQEAEQRGLVGRKLGKSSFAIANQGSDDLITSHRNDAITDDEAFAIATTAPNNEPVQALGIRAALDGKSVDHIKNLMRAVSINKPVDTTGDLFGFDDSAMREAEQMANIATAEQNKLKRLRSAAKVGAKANELQGLTEGKISVVIQDKKHLDEYVSDLDKQIAAWDNWPTSPYLVNQIKSRINGYTNKVSDEPKQARGVDGLKLSKEQRKQVLKTLVDVYKSKGADKETRINARGEEYSAYPYQPDLFEKSDITGAMVRYYVTMPDGKIAHPTELFADVTQAKIDSILAEQNKEDQVISSEVERITSKQFDSVEDAGRYWDEKSDEQFKKSGGGVRSIPNSFDRTAYVKDGKIIMPYDGVLTGNPKILTELKSRGWIKYTKTTGGENAIQEPKTKTFDASRGAQPGIRKESGDTTVSGEGISRSRQELRSPERLKNSQITETEIEVEGGTIRADKALEYNRERIDYYRRFIDCIQQ